MKNFTKDETSFEGSMKTKSVQEIDPGHEYKINTSVLRPH